MVSKAHAASVALALLVGSGFADPQAQGSHACTQLAAKYPDNVILPAAPGFTTEAIDNWSETCQVTPTCIFAPSSAQQVSGGLTILRQANQTFALRTGGHMPIPGASSISGGVLLDTVNISSIAYADNSKAIVQVGAGHRWTDVYDFLEKDNLAVNGGRFGPVGVSGLTLGGGITYFASEFGWTCSTVQNYEIVLANGTITQANAKTNSDLFWALKGGASNYGIVTRFDMTTFTVDNIWGGEALYNSSALDQLVNAYASYTVAQGGSSDPDVHSDPSILVNITTGEVTAYSVYMHRGNKAFPPSLQNFTDIPATFSDLRGGRTIQGLRNDTNPAGFSTNNRRQLFSSTATVSSAASVRLINQTLFDMIAAHPEIKKVDDLSVTNTYQLFTPAMIQAAKKSGGDPMGLYDPNGNGINAVLYGANWADAKDDQTVYNFIQDMVDTLDARAKKAGLYYDFVYQNDGAPTQTRDVFQKFSNGTALPKMKTIAKKYDPTGVFQTLLPGGFKLSNAQ